jgi:hypothetical protein
MRRGARRAALGLLLCGSILLPAATSFAQASDEDKAAARALATQGSDALKGNRYAEALDLVTRAEAIVHAPTHLLMIARSHAGLGKLVAAQETYLKLLREELSANAPPAFKNAQISAREELAAIEPRIGALRILVDGNALAAKKATVKLDDVAVPPALLGVFRPIDPGAHVVTILVPGLNPTRQSIDLGPAQKLDIRPVIPDGPAPAGVPVNVADNPDAGHPQGPGSPQPPDGRGGGFFSPLRGVGIGLGVVGVAGIAVGALFVAKGFASQSQANTDAMNAFCLPPSYTNCPIATPTQATQIHSEDVNAANQKTIGVILLPIGVAALGAGAALLVVGKPKPAGPSGAGATVTPWFAGTSGGLRGSF